MRNAFYKDKVLEGSKRWSLQIILLIFLTMGSLLIYVTNQREFFVSSPYITSEAPKREFCSAVMSQMIEKKLSSKLMEEGLFELVTRDNYGALYITGKEQIKGIWSTEESCKVLIRGEQLRAFDLYLDNSGQYPFYYIVTKITEHELFDKENN